MHTPLPCTQVSLVSSHWRVLQHMHWQQARVRGPTGQFSCPISLQSLCMPQLPGPWATEPFQPKQAANEGRTNLSIKAGGQFLDTSSLPLVLHAWLIVTCCFFEIAPELAMNTHCNDTEAFLYSTLLRPAHHACASFSAGWLLVSISHMIRGQQRRLQKAQSAHEQAHKELTAKQEEHEKQQVRFKHA